MSKKWIAIVNRIEARIFDGETMTLVHRLSNNLGREKNRAFTTGRPGVGRNRTAAKASTHNLTGEKNPHAEAAMQFARKVNLFLSKRLGEKAYETLLVSAEPRMKGWIKTKMPKAVSARCEWNSKDLNKLSDHDLKVLFLGKGAVWPAASPSNF